MLKRSLFAALAALLVVCPARATLTTTTSVAQYTSNGVATVYSFPYRFLDQSYLVVTKTVSAVTTTLVLGTDYTVTGANLSAGGSVTLTVAVANGGTLKIMRSTPLTQTCNFRTTPVAGPAVEACLDRLMMVIQEKNDGTFTQLVATPITTAQASVAAPSTVPNSANTNVTGTSSAFAAADHVHALAVGPMLGANTAAGQSIPNSGVATIVVFGTVERDTDSGYVAGTGRYTIPVGKGGDYEITGAVDWSSAATGAFIQLFKNASVLKTLQYTGPAGTAAAGSIQNGTTTVNLSAGDVIDIRVGHTSGGAVTLAAIADRNFFALKRVQ